jgi:hypothetical protein
MCHSTCPGKLPRKALISHLFDGRNEDGHILIKQQMEINTLKAQVRELTTDNISLASKVESLVASSAALNQSIVELQNTSSTEMTALRAAIQTLTELVQQSAVSQLALQKTVSDLLCVKLTDKLACPVLNSSEAHQHHAAVHNEDDFEQIHITEPEQPPSELSATSTAPLDIEPTIESTVVCDNPTTFSEFVHHCSPFPKRIAFSWQEIREAFNSHIQREMDKNPAMKWIVRNKSQGMCTTFILLF